MKKISALFCFGLALFVSSCKKENVDPCVEDFVGTWNCSISGQYTGGSCSSGGEIKIQPGPDGGCQVLFPGAPSYCNVTSYQVLGSVSGDSIFINNEPLGGTFVSGWGRVYLNQLTMQLNQADGKVSSISGTKN